MVKSAKRNFQKIELDKKRLRQCGVGALIVFGSQVEGVAHIQSDIDVGVVFENLEPLKADPVEVYGLLYEELTCKMGRKVDIVYLHEAPLSLQFNAVTEGVPIFYTSKEFFYDYKERVILLYLDFRYFENIFDEALLET
jgi:predicted nucleotidyltransferase